MKFSHCSSGKPLLAWLLGVFLIPLWISCGPSPNSSPPGAGGTNATLAGSTNRPSAATNAPATVATNAPSAATTNAPPAGTNVTAAAGATNAPPPGAATAAAGATTNAPPANEPIQVAFQGANVDMIVQWLASTTGKTVVKHPRVQCQLTIVSSKKVTPREALELVYRALALEGFNAVETRNSIFLIPEGQDLKLSPEILNAGTSDIPEGRQKMMKMFTLTHLPAGEIRERIRGVLSEKATIDIDERANALVVTDFNDNLRLVGELLKELDVTSVGDAVVEIFRLKHAEADEIGNLISLILNAQFGGSAASTRPAGGGGGGGGRSSGGPMPDGGGPPPPGGGGGGASASMGNPMQVRIWPDRSSNRLIVSTPKSKLEDVRKLVDLLDTDKPGDMTVRVLPLKSVQATDLVKEIQPLFQKMNAKAPKEAVEIAANERSNSLIVLSTESNFKRLSDFVTSLDTEDAQEKVIRTYALKNADAQDVAKQLQQLNTDQDTSSRFRYFYYGSDPQQSSKKMSVVADRRRNSLIVQAPPAQIPGIEKMIKELDEPVGEDNLAPRIYQLKYVSAIDMEDVLNEIFLKKTQRRSYYYYDEDFFGGGDNSVADRDVGRLYGKVRITSEPYSNTLIVTANSKENLAVVEEMLEKLDVPSQAGETTIRVGLRFAKATAVANSLNIIFAKNGSPTLRQTPQQQQQNPNQPAPPGQPANSTPIQASFELSLDAREDGYFPWLGGPPDNPRNTEGRTGSRQVSDLVGRVRVVPDDRGNSLLLSANAHLLPQIMKLIDDMDSPSAEVLIEARILEVATDKLDKLGVRWSPDGSQVFSGDDFDNSIMGNVKGRYITGFGGKTMVNSPSSGEVAQMLTSLRSGFLDSTLNLDVLIQFLRKTTDATVLAAPQINVSDNEMGRLFVGQQVPFIDNSQTTDQGGLNQSFRYKLVGVILEVTPHINKAGDVSLRIRAESSAIQPGQIILGGAVIDTRNFRTDVTTHDGETLILGGIIQKQISDTLRKTPFLGDIPGLGWAFKKKDKSVRNVELMVFLRPKITRTPEQARKLLDDLDQTAPLIAPWKNGNVPVDPNDFKKPNGAKETKEKPPEGAPPPTN